MAHWISADRIHLRPAVTHDGSPSRSDAGSPSATAAVGLAGGATQARPLIAKRGKRARPAANVFYLTTAAGEVTTTDRGEYRTYESSKPTGAATKVFRVYMRSDAGRRALAMFKGTATASVYAAPKAGLSSATAAMLTKTLAKPALDAYFAAAGATPLPSTVEAALAAALDKGSLTHDDAAKYRAAYWADDAALYAFTVDVYVGRAGKQTVRHYQVRYTPLLKPNAHEIKKGINKVAKATYVPKHRAVAPAVACASDMDASRDDDTVRHSPRPKRARRF